MLDIPLITQNDIAKDRHEMCGAACLQMVYQYYGIQCDQDDLWMQIKDEHVGLGSGQKMLIHALSKGLFPVLLYSSKKTAVSVLKYLSDAQAPAILCAAYSLARVDRHYVVLLGYMSKGGKDYIAINDPMRMRKGNVLIKDFLSQWEDNSSPYGYGYIAFGARDEMPYFCSVCDADHPVNQHWRPLQLLEGKVTFACPYSGKMISSKNS